MLSACFNGGGAVPWKEDGERAGFGWVREVLFASWAMVSDLWMGRGGRWVEIYLLDGVAGLIVVLELVLPREVRERR